MKKLSFAIAGILFCFSVFAQQKGTLNLPKGKTLHVESKIQTDSKTNYMGQEMENKADITSVYEIQVEDVVNNQYKISSTVKSMKLKMEQMGQELTYDSENPDDANNPLAASLSDVLNKKQMVTLDKNGKVVNEAKDDSPAAPMVKQLEESGYGTNLAFIPLPANLKAGDTWTVSEGDTAGVQNTTHYTVKSIDGNIASLDFKGETKSNLTMENQGMEIKTNTQGTFEGNATVDKTTGLVQTSKSTIKSSGNVSVMGQDYPTSVVVISDTTVK